MQKSLVALGVFLALLCLNLEGAPKVKIQWIESIQTDKEAGLRGMEAGDTLRDFCVTEDNVFIVPDSDAGCLKLLSKEGQFLKFRNKLGPRFAQFRFVTPRYCFYSIKSAHLGVIDYGTKSIFVFERIAKVDFRFIKNIPCERMPHNIKFSEDGNHAIISGYITDKGSNPYDLYGVDIKTGKINFMMPSYKKYFLKNHKEYVTKYRVNQEYAGVGYFAYLDVCGDWLFYIWEGALQAQRIDLETGERKLFGKETQHYVKPDSTKLGKLYSKAKTKAEYESTWKAKQGMAFVKNIFATPKHVLIVYRTAKNLKSNAYSLRLHVYTYDGELLDDVLIPHTPNFQMWFNKEEYELFAFRKEEVGKSVQGNSLLTIQRYRVIISK